MFIDFLYFLRTQGIRVTAEEWLTLMDALEQGLHDSSLTGFFYLARMILVHSETELDRFDQAFAAYFQEIEHLDTLPAELADWLRVPRETRNYTKELIDRQFQGLPLEVIRAMMEDRLRDQTERHDCGNHWIGTGGTSLFGNSGYNPNGLRVEGESQFRSALQIAGERHYRDFRGNTALDIRQFQMAFRKLRSLHSCGESPRDELRLEDTIRSTCNNGGFLKLEFGHPRKNEVRLLLLFDSGGSMWSYAQLCRKLFHAVNQSNRFRELRTYYFHNCVYECLHTTPECRFEEIIDTEQVLQEITPEWKVIFVGDGEMAPSELLSPKGRHDYFHPNELPGLYWLRRFTARYPHLVWLNPISEERWGHTFGAETIHLLQEEVTMLPLTLDGLDQAVKRLLVAR